MRRERRRDCLLLIGFLEGRAYILHIGLVKEAFPPKIAPCPLFFQKNNI
jgi:hypothetical protein